MTQPPHKPAAASSTVPGRRPASPQRLAYRLHVYSGLASAAILLIIAVTGIALNHTDALGLASRHTTAPLLLHWYGFQPPSEARAVTVGDSRIAQLDELLYLNGQRLPPVGQVTPGGLLGAAASSQWLAVLTQARLLLLTPSGELIESTPLPAQLQDYLRPGSAVGLGSDGQDNPCIEAQAHYWRYGLTTGDWQPAPHCAGKTHRPAALPAKEIERLLPDYYATSLSLERIVLDLHSGRIFGQGGVLVFDGAALLLLLQAITGVITWWRRR